eukprot:318548-Prorocentrum_minimum.AAC.1
MPALPASDWYAVTGSPFLQEIIEHNMDLIIRSLDKEVVVRRNVLPIVEEELQLAPAVGPVADGELQLTLNAIDR